MCLEVVGYTLEEDLLAQVCAQHANDGTSLEITDVVENLVNLESIEDRDLNGMRRAEGIECKGLLNRISLHKCQSAIENEYLETCDVLQTVPRRSNLRLC